MQGSVEGGNKEDPTSVYNFDDNEVVHNEMKSHFNAHFLNQFLVANSFDFIFVWRIKLYYICLSYFSHAFNGIFSVRECLFLQQLKLKLNK